MPSIKNYTSDYDIENDCNEEISDNEQNSIIKCGEILFFKCNLLILCGYCEETINNFEIFTNHLFEKHLNTDINQSNINNNNELNIVFEDNIKEELYTNELAEIQSPVINNINVEDEKYIKQDLETYEEKFYKYCKLFKEKEATEIRKNFNVKFNNVMERSNIEEKSNSIQQIDSLTNIISNNNIKLAENNEEIIFYDNIINDIIEEDPTMSTVTLDENHTDNIIDHEIKNHLEKDNNNEIKNDNFVDTINNNIEKEDQNKLITRTFNQNVKEITAISTKINNFYHCPECPRYYRRFDTLKIHYRLHTGEKNSYTCLLCDKSFYAPCKLIQHHRVHTGERPYKCTLCPQAFKAKQKLKNHLESHEKGTIKTPSIYVNGVSILERQPACLPILVNNKFITSSEAKKEDGLFHCPICERKYRRFESLKEHADIHVEPKQYECHVCNKRFTKVRSLKVHIKSHTQNKNLRWNGVPIPCDYCEKTFSNKYYLMEHMCLHTGKRPYECKICKKRFVFKSNFVLHERTHTSDKRYQCKFCDMKFVQSTTKVRHERVVHLKLAPFTCKFCQKGFYTSSIYKKHISDHKNEEVTSSKEFYSENYTNNENEDKTIIANDEIEQTIIVDNSEENIMVVENYDFKINEFICSNCGAYFLDCGEYIEHCKGHDNNIIENIVHYMQDDIVGSEEIIV